MPKRFRGALLVGLACLAIASSACSATSQTGGGGVTPSTTGRAAGPAIVGTATPVDQIEGNLESVHSLNRVLGDSEGVRVFADSKCKPDDCANILKTVAVSKKPVVLVRGDVITLIEGNVPGHVDWLYFCTGMTSEQFLELTASEQDTALGLALTLGSILQAERGVTPQSRVPTSVGAGMAQIPLHMTCGATTDADKWPEGA